jgi:hypothetical protein
VGIVSSVANQVTITWTSVTPATTYTVTLYTQAGAFVGQTVNTFSAPGSRTSPFSGLTTGDIYYGIVTSTQNGYSTTCQSNPITCS